jgi:CheY-like chemotaxis protein
MSRRSLHILLVEDDEIDVEFVIRGFRSGEGQQIITVAGDGIEALDILRGQSGHAKLVQPYLIITDISMPLMNGIEFLRNLRRDPQLRQSLVFVLTGSALEADKLAAYDLQVAGYLLKAKMAANWSLLVSLVRCYQEHVEFPS